jgi:hypothetical protein
MIPPYELDHAAPAFLRGYWDGYKCRPRRGITCVARREYERGFLIGTNDAAEFGSQWRKIVSDTNNGQDRHHR